MLVLCWESIVNFTIIHMNFILKACQFLYSWSIILHFNILLYCYLCGLINWYLHDSSHMQHVMKVINSFYSISFFIMRALWIINDRAPSVAWVLAYLWFLRLYRHECNENCVYHFHLSFIGEELPFLPDALLPGFGVLINVMSLIMIVLRQQLYKLQLFAVIWSANIALKHTTSNPVLN